MLQVARGEAGALRQLIERHRGRVMRVGFAILRDAAEAEDIVQETFARVWMHAGSWQARRSASFVAWLTRVAVNLAIDTRRRQRPAAPGEAEAMAAVEITADQRVAGQEIAARIRAALGQLPQRQRTAFAMCQIARMRNAEAARSLGISVGALELLLVRARRSMRRQLADLYEGSR